MYGKPQQTVTRTFGGVVPPKTSFDSAHLKAYLKGHTYFFKGIERTSDGKPMRNFDGSIVRTRHKVDAKLIKEDLSIVK